MTTMEDLFAPVDGGRISVQIVNQVQDAIRSGQLVPGDRLPPERELAERFAVSRVTVRDALRSLEVLGLIQIRVGATGGAFVTSPRVETVGEGLTNLMLLSGLEHSEIAQARLVLELGSVYLATARAKPADIERLQAMVRKARADLRAGRYERTMSLSFHLAIAEVAGNRAVTMLTETFRGPLSMHAIREHEGRDSFAHTVSEHAEIAAAIARGDARAAGRAMADHLSRGTTLTEDDIAPLLEPQGTAPQRPARRRTTR